MDNDTRNKLIMATDRLRQWQETAKQRGEKKLWQEVMLPCSFEDILQRLSKDELTEICKHNNFAKMSTLKKSELVERLAYLLPAKAIVEFELMDEERFSFIRQFVNVEKSIYPVMEVEGISMDALVYWRLEGMVFTGSLKGKKVIFVPREIIDAFQVLNKQSLQKNVQRNTEWILLTQGLLFYYGVLRFRQIVQQLEELTGIKPDSEKLQDVLWSAKNYYELTQTDMFGYWAHSEVPNINRLLEEQWSQREVSYRKFSKSQLLKAGSPDFREKNPAFQQFSKLLQKYYSLSRENADNLTHECQRVITRNFNPTAVFDFLEEKIKIPTEPMFGQHVLDEIRHLANNSRRWVLKGLTAEELNPFKTPEVDARPVQTRNNVISIKSHVKAGRNEPCPCGSGKKFKHCCGKL